MIILYFTIIPRSQIIAFATKAWFALSSMLIYRAAFSLSLGPLTSQRGTSLIARL